MPDRPYHHGNLTEALMTAGFEAARTGGPSAIALRVLAKEVGVSPTAAYRHFASLHHLVAAVSQRAREQMATRMAEAMAQVDHPDPSERAWRRLAANGRAYVRFALDEPSLFATAFAPCLALPPREDDPDAWGLLVGALEDLANLGELAPGTRATAPFVAWAAVHGAAEILGRAAINSAMVPPGEPPMPGDQPGPIDPDAAFDAVRDALRRALGA